MRVYTDRQTERHTHTQTTTFALVRAALQRLLGAFLQGLEMLFPRNASPELVAIE